MEADLDIDLERRLRRLAAHVELGEADETAIARLAVPPRPVARKRPWGRVVPAAAGVLAFLLLGNAVGIYLAPRYAAALASAPGAGLISEPALRWAGLSPGSLTVLSDKVTAGGHTVRLVAGRADAVRTALFIEVDGVAPGSNLCLPPRCTDKHSKTVVNPNAWFVNRVSVTDQFGHTYGQIDYASFEPLTGPATAVGARLTVRVESLVRQNEAGRLDALSGDWTLHATLLPQPVPALALPPPVQFEGNTYRITSARGDGLATVDVLVTGPAVEQMRSFAYGPAPRQPSSGDPRQEPMGQLSQRYFDMRVTAPDGSDVLVHFYGYTTPRRGPMRGEVVFPTPVPGPYLIRFGTGAEVRVTVPPPPRG